MRARTVVLIFCLVLSLLPCYVTSSRQQTKRKLNYAQVATYYIVAAGAQTVLSTIIATYYADLVRGTNPDATRTSSRSVARDVLEFVDAKVNQELASRGLGQVPLDELD